MSRRECPGCNGKMTEVTKDHYKCDHCKSFYKVVGGELVPGGEAEIYDEARKLIPEFNNGNDYTALRLFDMLGSYSNSSVMAEKLRRKIDDAELQEEIRKTKNADRIQLIKILVVIVLAIVFIMSIASTIKRKLYQKKRSIYNEAVALYDAGDYHEAINKFKKVRKFSNTEEYIEQANANIEEQRNCYQNGVDYYEANLYTRALEEFSKLPVSYEKREIYIEQCAAALYSQAEEYYKEDDINDAVAILTNFPKNTGLSIKAEAMLNTVNEELIEREKCSEYETALRLYEEGNYIAAQRGFINLGDYKNSLTQDYLAEIGSVFYQEALTAYNEGDYEYCAEIIKSIDSEDEWTSYKMAQELLDSAKQIYVAPIKEEAKKLCRSSGYSEMSSYIDSQICILLSSSEASMIKKECEVKRVEMRTLNSYRSGRYGLGSWTSLADTLGNHYDFSYSGYMDEGDNAYEVFYIGDKNYMTLISTVAVGQQGDRIHEGCVGGIRIYGDDKLLWSDTNITSRTKPYRIEVSIAGVSDLQIQMWGDGNMGTTGLTSLLCDPILVE